VQALYLLLMKPTSVNTLIQAPSNPSSNKQPESKDFNPQQKDMATLPNQDISSKVPPQQIPSNGISKYKFEVVAEDDLIHMDKIKIRRTLLSLPQSKISGSKIAPDATPIISDNKKKKTETVEKCLNIIAHKYTLVLDLDQTLICCTKNDLDSPINFDLNGAKYKYNISIRPYALDFIKNISSYYNIMIYTNSYYQYAQEVVNLLDKEHKYINPSNIIACQNPNEISKPKVKSIQLCLAKVAIIPAENYVIFDDNQKVWDLKDINKILLSMKYFSSMSEINFEDVTNFWHKDKFLSITQILVSKKQSEFPYLETYDSRLKQLKSIESFLVDTVTAHKESSTMSYNAVLTKKRLIFSGIQFNCYHLKKECIASPKEVASILDALKCVIESLGGSYSDDKAVKSLSSYYIYLCQHTNEMEPVGKCICYRYVIDCYFHMKLLEEGDYQVLCNTVC
jgi:TFIIF-interacting CTD phosphatase-like protein